MKNENQEILILKKQINDLQSRITENILPSIAKIATQQQSQIEQLLYKCSALECIQIVIFNALSEIDSTIHSRITNELRESLEYIEKQGKGDTAFADYLREIINPNTSKKPHLRLIRNEDDD